MALLALQWLLAPFTVFFSRSLAAFQNNHPHHHLRYHQEWERNETTLIILESSGEPVTMESGIVKVVSSSKTEMESDIVGVVSLSKTEMSEITR